MGFGPHMSKDGTKYRFVRIFVFGVIGGAVVANRYDMTGAWLTTVQHGVASLIT